MEEGANVMLMIGCDFHPGMQELCVLNTETGRRREQWLSHDLGPAPVREFFSGLSKPVRVGLEASGYSQWFEEMLEELGIELWVGDPARIRKAAPRKQKTDRNDAPRRREARGLTWPRYGAATLSEHPASRASGSSTL